MSSTIPTEQRIWRLHAIGGPEVLRLDSLPMPKPGPGQVLVRVKAMAFNRSDLLWMGAAFYKPTPPAKVGNEMCGVVEQVGEGVKGFKPGDRVNNYVDFYIGDYGCFGDYALLPASCLMPTPEALSDAQGAAYSMYFTSYMALREMADLRAYQYVLITAASSATATTAMSIARKVGATVIATTSNRSKRDQLLATGAQHVICTQDEDLTARVREITGGQGVDLAFDCVAGPQIRSIIAALKNRGHLICYGFLDMTPVTLQWYECFATQPRIEFLSLLQFTGDPYFGKPPRHDAVERAKQFIVNGVGDGSLPVHIAKQFQGLDAVPEALTFMQGNVGGGKIVLTL